MKTTKISPAAIAAAEWWAGAVGAPSFNHVSNEERDDISDMTQMMASMLAAKFEVSEEAGAKFATELAKIIDKQLTDRDWGVTLGVDYGPDRELAEAAEKAGINRSRFPWKTNMWIKHDHVTVSAGYRAATELIWASDEWLANRPMCASRKWDEDKYMASLDKDKPWDRRYRGEPWVCSKPKYHDGDCIYDHAQEVES